MAEPPRPRETLPPDIVFIDVESSGLEEGSYPIEVGICDDGLAPLSWLVRPPPAWGDRDWHAPSEAIHGIPRDLLLSDGMPVAEVADILSARLAGRAVHSDAPAWDGYWLRRLFEEAGRTMPFHLHHETEAYARYAPTIREGGIKDYIGRWKRAVARAGRIFPHTHRAGPDALNMAAAFRMTGDEAYASVARAFDPTRANRRRGSI